MWLVVGLGNPGAEYQSTRHNIGFLALDALAAAADAKSFSRKFSGDVAQVTWGGEKLILLKPTTFMNHSGRSVQAAMAFYKIAPSHIIVLHDEMALPLPKLRIKQGGGDNGHNGIKDIDVAIGPDYWRIRLGIGHPGDGALVHNHVLSNFSKDERKEAERMLGALTKHFPLFWSHSPEALGSKVAAELNPPKKKDATAPAAPAKATGE